MHIAHLQLHTWAKAQGDSRNMFYCETRKQVYKRYMHVYNNVQLLKITSFSLLYEGTFFSVKEDIFFCKSSPLTDEQNSPE